MSADPVPFLDTFRNAAFTLTDEEQERLDAIFNAGADRIKTADNHWIFNSDEGEDYCRKCVDLKIKELLASKPNGNYQRMSNSDSDHDHLPSCATCGIDLEGTLTDEGCDYELQHFLENGFSASDDHDCYALSHMISTRGWNHWPNEHARPSANRASQEYHWDLGKLARQILAALES